jgi:hypothetical protein
MTYMLVGVALALLASILMGIGKYPVGAGIGLVIGIYCIFKGREKMGLAKKE